MRRDLVVWGVDIKVICQVVIVEFFIVLEVPVIAKQDLIENSDNKKVNIQPKYNIKSTCNYTISTHQNISYIEKLYSGQRLRRASGIQAMSGDLNEYVVTYFRQKYKA